jgi:8-oxo-dGTP pyrophosphatase MutT (NUDIX family)
VADDWAKSNFVLGFVFDEKLERVLIIKKNRPEFLANLYNGIGGKTHPGETGKKAMTREFAEEAGLTIPTRFWRLQSIKNFSSSSEMRIFYAVIEDELFDQARTLTDEPVVPMKLDAQIEPSAAWLFAPGVPDMIQACREAALKEKLGS